MLQMRQAVCRAALACLAGLGSSYPAPQSQQNQGFMADIDFGGFIENARLPGDNRKANGCSKQIM